MENDSFFICHRNGSLFIPDNGMLTEHALLSCYQIQVTIQQLSDLFHLHITAHSICNGLQRLLILETYTST